MSKKVFLISLLFLFVVGCSSSGGSEEVVQGPLPQVFVFPGPQEERLISREIIKQPNCNGTAETSQTVQRSHTVLYTLELASQITVKADGKAGIPGIGEVGVGTQVAAHYQVGYGQSETVGRSVTVAAAPDSHIEHIVQQFEVWETGEVLIVAGEINQRLPYNFRRDFSIKVVDSANIGCPGGQSIEPSTSNSGTSTLQSTPISPQSNCQPDQALGLVELWHHTNRQWSLGIWGTPSVVNFTMQLATVDSTNPNFNDFQIWISPCNTHTHAYVNGAQFWPIDGSGAEIPNRPVMLGQLTNVDYITPNSGRWTLGNPP